MSRNRRADTGKQAAELVAACKLGTVSTILSLIGSQADVNCMDANGELPLVEALIHERWDAALLLLQQGRVDAYKSDGEGKLPLNSFLLSNAPARMTEKLIELLLSRGADPNLAGKGGLTALMLAASNDNSNAVRLLLPNLRNVDAKNADGKSAMLIAAESGFEKVLSQILEVTKIGINAAIEQAVRRMHCECVRLLLESNADASMRLEEGYDLLFASAKNGDLATMSYLLEHGASPLSINTDGSVTALIQVVRLGHSSSAALLIDKGATLDSNSIGCICEMRNYYLLEYVINKAGIVILDTRVPMFGLPDFSFFCFLIQEKAIELVSRMLQLGIDPNIADSAVTRNTPLMLALKNGCDEVVDLLLRHPKTDLLILNAAGDSSLKIAAGLGRKDIVVRLIQLGAPPNDMSVIHEAVKNNQTEVISTLFNSRGFNVSFEHEEIRNVFHLACSQGNVECVKLFLSYHLKTHGSYKAPEFSNTIGAALMRAVDEKRLPLIQMLATNGADSESLAASLVLCSKHGIHESLRTLINCKANVNYTSEKKSTPLTVAAKRWGRSGSSDHWQCVRLLVSSAADVTTRDAKENSVLKWAAIQGSETLLSQLVKTKGVDIDAVDLSGWTPVMYAVQANHLKCVEILLDRGADVDVTGLDGATASTLATRLWRMKSSSVPPSLLRIFTKTRDTTIRDVHGDSISTWAALLGHNDCMTMLASRKDFKPDWARKDGKTALYLACRENHRDVALTLLKAKANARVYVGDGADNEVPLLMLAINKGWQDVALAAILAGGASVDSDSDAYNVGNGSGEGVSYLQMCIEWGWHDCVAALVDAGFDTIDSGDNTGLTPLLCAARRGNSVVLRQMLERGSTRGGREAAVLIAAVHAHLECISTIIECDDGSLDSSCLETAIHIAAMNGNEDIMGYLLRIFGSEGIDRAIKLSDRILEAMDRRSALATIPDTIISLEDELAMTSLMQASRGGHVGCVTMLLEFGALVDISNDTGWTATLLASLNGHLSTVKELLWWGARINPTRTAAQTFNTMRRYAAVQSRFRMKGTANNKGTLPALTTPTTVLGQSGGGNISTPPALDSPLSSSPEGNLLSSPGAPPSPALYSIKASTLSQVDSSSILGAKLLGRGLGRANLSSSQSSSKSGVEHMKRVHRKAAESLMCDADIGEGNLPSLLPSLLLAASHGGHENVVNLLVEAGCNHPQAIRTIDNMISSNSGHKGLWERRKELLIKCTDYQVHGPYGIDIPGHNDCNFEDKNLPDKALRSVHIYIGHLGWDIKGIQFVFDKDPDAENASTKAHMLRGTEVQAKRKPSTFNLESGEYITQIEMAIGTHYVMALRFTTNKQTSHWYGEFNNGNVNNAEILVVKAAQREIVGVTGFLHDRFYKLGFISRLRSPDYEWRRLRNARGNNRMKQEEDEDDSPKAQKYHPQKSRKLGIRLEQLRSQDKLERDLKKWSKPVLFEPKVILTEIEI